MFGYDCRPATVSIHAPMQGATKVFYSSARWTSFNPRPYARGDENKEWTMAYSEVSIHAPMQGATKNACQLAVTFAVSIHAPMQGATGVRGFMSSKWCFNPRPYARGDDLVRLGGVYNSLFQSTPLCKGRHGSD